MNELAVYALVFTVTAAVAFLALSTINLVRRDEDPGLDPVRPVFGPATRTVAGLLPSTAAGRDKVRRDLLRAGYFEPVAWENFTAVRAVMTYLPLLAGEIGAVFAPAPFVLPFLIVGLVGGVLGYAVPRLLVALQADRRTDEIRRGLPMLMDTLGLTLSTGASLPAGLARSAEAIRRGYPALAEEVRVVLAQAELRSLADALDKWRDRQPIPELGSLVYLLGQADRLGADITRGLWELSASLQVTARQRAEAAANRANFYLTFPTVLCLLIAAGLILAGPGLVQLIESNRQVDTILNNVREQEQRLRRDAEGKGKAGAPTVAPLQPPPASGL